MFSIADFTEETYFPVLFENLQPYCASHLEQLLIFILICLDRLVQCTFHITNIS